MAVSYVTAPRAAFNGVRALSPHNHVSSNATEICRDGPRRQESCLAPCFRDGFSRLLTRFSVAIACTRRHEAAMQGQIMHAPAELIGLLRHAASPRAHRLMTAGFNGIERLAQLRLFCEEFTPAIRAAA